MNNSFNFDNYTYPDMNPVNQFTFQTGMANEMNKNHELAGPYDGFIRGNLFDNLYNQYKNYRPMKLVPNNEQAEMLLNVDQLSFAAHELNLYLDVYPDDQKMFALFQKYRAMANEAIQKYERKYGPLNISANAAGNNFAWEKETWPWEMGVM